MATLEEKLTQEASAQKENPEADMQIWTHAFCARSDGIPLLRIDLRQRSGSCVSLSYDRLAEIQFNLMEDGGNEILLDFTPVWWVRVLGTNLQDIYELLQTHSVWWLREGNSDEKESGIAFIEAIEAVKLTSPLLAGVELERRLEAIENEPSQSE